MSANWASHDAGSVDWIVSLLAARIDSATKSSHALRRPSLEPKWWITRAALTPGGLGDDAQADVEAVLAELLDRRVADAGGGRQIVD